MADCVRTLSFSTIRVYLHGIATTQVELGFSSPLTENSIIWRMYRAIKRLQGAAVAKIRLPITTNVLMKVEHLHKLDRAKFSEAQVRLASCLRAAMWLGTCGLLRSGEFAWKNRDSATLRRNQLSFHNEDDIELNGLDACRLAAYMKVRLEKSKTDPFREGTDVLVSNPIAIQAMCHFLGLRDRTQGSGALPLFDTGLTTSCVLTVAKLVEYTQSLLNEANIINAHLYKGHSFRKGGATSLHEAGMPDSLIKSMGRWQSFAFATYVATSNPLLIRAGRAMTAARVLNRRVTFDSSRIMTWDD